MPDQRKDLEVLNKILTAGVHTHQSGNHRILSYSSNLPLSEEQANEAREVLGKYNIAANVHLNYMRQSTGIPYFYVVFSQNPVSAIQKAVSQIQKQQIAEAMEEESAFAAAQRLVAGLAMQPTSQATQEAGDKTGRLNSQDAIREKVILSELLKPGVIKKVSRGDYKHGYKDPYKGLWECGTYDTEREARKVAETVLDASSVLGDASSVLGVTIAEKSSTGPKKYGLIFQANPTEDLKRRLGNIGQWFKAADDELQSNVIPSMEQLGQVIGDYAQNAQDEESQKLQAIRDELDENIRATNKLAEQLRELASETSSDFSAETARSQQAGLTKLGAQLKGLLASLEKLVNSMMGRTGKYDLLKANQKSTASPSKLAQLSELVKHHAGIVKEKVGSFLKKIVPSRGKGEVQVSGFFDQSQSKSDTSESTPSPFSTTPKPR